MRVGKLKKWTDLRDEVVAISRAIAVAEPQPTRMDIGAVGRRNQARVVRDRMGLANVTIRLSKHVPGAETRITLLQTVLTLTKRAENVERLVIWQVCVDLLERLSPRPRVVRRAREVAKVRMLPRRVGIVVSGHMSLQCPRKKVHAVEESTTANHALFQDTIMVGSVGSYVDVGSVSEVTVEPTGGDEKICSRMCVKGNPLTSTLIQVLK